MKVDADKLAEVLENSNHGEKILRTLADRGLGELVDDSSEGLVLVLDRDTWYADDGNCEIETDADNPLDACREYAKDGSWDRDRTIWITPAGYRKGLNANGDWVRVDFEEHTITLEPDEPDCTCDEGHDWCSPYSVLGGLKDNPGVWGHGGGVIITEVCRHCGAYRVTDTWAQNPDNGVQRLRSVQYREPDEASIEWIADE